MIDSGPQRPAANGRAPFVLAVALLIGLGVGLAALALVIVTQPFGLNRIDTAGVDLGPAATTGTAPASPTTWQPIRPDDGADPVDTTDTDGTAAADDASSPTGSRPVPDGHDDEFGPEALAEANREAAEAAAAANDSGEPTVLRLIYFVEDDQEFDPLAVEAIEAQALELQIFWYEQFGGTFRLPADGVEVIFGDRTAAWYDETEIGDDPRWYRLMNIRAELARNLGASFNDPSMRMLVYPHGRIDGRVGANRYEGAWLDGDDITCVDGESTPYTADFPADCLGAVAHELGHVFGLTHEGPDDDCMQYGFYRYENGLTRCEFSAANRQLVVDDPRNANWLDARPGDRG